MVNIIGWILLCGSLIWVGLVTFFGLEVTTNQIAGNSAEMLAGAILIHKRN